MTYQIKLPQFEGPFDLLLFFIERDELEVHDIPISKITNDFLDYLHQLNELNIEVASEFILVAATLMRIKAKMLLPRKDLDDQGKEIDPRKELVDRLMEYKQYKEIVGALKTLEDQRLRQVKRGNVPKELEALASEYSTEIELQSISLFKLLKAFERVLNRNKEVPFVQHTVYRYPYSIESQRKFLITLIKREGKVSFFEVFSTMEDKVHAIYTFLSLLELIQQKVLDIKIGLGVNNFWITSLQNVNLFTESD